MTKKDRLKIWHLEREASRARDLMLKAQMRADKFWKERCEFEDDLVIAGNVIDMYRKWFNKHPYLVVENLPLHEYHTRVLYSHAKKETKDEEVEGD